MKKVLYILPVAERGGAERIHESWAKAFKQNKQIQPHIILPKDGVLRTYFEDIEVEVIIPPDFRLRNLLPAVQFLKQYIKSQSIDIIHSSMPYSHIFGGLASLLTGCPEVWSSHGPIPDRYFQGWMPLIPSSTLLVHSQYMYKLQEKTLYNAKKIRLIPYGVDTELVQPKPNNRQRLIEKYKLPANAIAVGIVGRIVSWKGQHVVLKAFSWLKTNFPNLPLYCFLIGDAIFNAGEDYRTEINHLVKELGVEEYTVLTGHIDNVYEYYDLLDIVVHASLIPEPFGLVVAEAMAKEKLVVATKGGGPSEMIEDGKTGFLYNAGDVIGLTEILTKLLNSSKSFQEAMGRGARESINSNFSIQRSAQCLMSTYQEILSS